MALSAFFLLFFLLQHLIINVTSVFSAATFNSLSHFMGTNSLIQFVMQPILLFGIVFHFFMGFILEFKNRNSREVSYVMSKGSASSSWMSKNMLYSGLVILAFMGFHFVDFWIPELTYKYIETNPSDPDRYFSELVHKFQYPVRVVIYVVAFILLALHLLHGFQSAFQSMGMNHKKYTPAIKKLGTAYAIFIPLGFIFIALFHYINSR